MGWSNNPTTRSRPATNGEKLAILMALHESANNLHNQQVSELTEALYRKYIESPDKDTRFLLLSYMGAEFLDREKSDLT